jgi:hypothetical protein
MKLRLEITTSPDNTFVFEHAGPSLRIGRDPAAELSLQGEASQAVSWDHARIELMPSGAYLSDQKSTNGTLLNDRRVVESTPLRVSDQIQLGHTGPVLKIVLLDLSPTRPVEADVPRPPVRAAGSSREAQPERVRKEPARRVTKLSSPPANTLPGSLLGGALRGIHSHLLVEIGALLLVGLLLVGLLLGGIALLRRPDPIDPTPSAPPVATADKDTPEPTTNRTPPLPPDKPPLPPIEVPPQGMPSMQRQRIGHYEEQKKIPSVLLVHQLAPNLLGRVRDQDRIETACYLTSLPGYHSKLVLDSGVHMELWGNVPEFSLFPPVLESTVMLHVAEPGLDLDFTLDHGRVHLAQFKPSGEAHVRVRFQRETWDVFLPDSRTEVVMEHFGPIPGMPVPKQPGEPVAFFGVYAKGVARLKVGEQQIKLPDSSALAWSSLSPILRNPQNQSELPDWWAPKLDPSDPAKGDMMVALGDLSERLKKDDEILDAIVTEVKGNEFVPHRALGVWCLGAVDAVFRLVDALEDPKRSEVRRAAASALWHWTNRSSDHEQALYRTLRETKQYAEEKARIVLGLLQSFSEAELANPATYETLADYLNHENLAIRELAFWHLFLLAPEAARSIEYDSAWEDPEKRKQAAQQWKKLIAEGKVPSRKG